MNSEQRSNRQANMATDAQAAGRDVRIPVREEELVTDTQLQEEGRVHLHKDVVEEQQTMQVPTRHERVRMERAPFSGEQGDTSSAFQGADIDIPVMGEQPVASKQVRGVEEVRLHKDVVTENKPVQGSLRREQVTVDDDVDDAYGAATARGTSSTFTASSPNVAPAPDAAIATDAVVVDGTKDSYRTAKGSFDAGETEEDGAHEGLGTKIRRGVDRLIHR